MAMAAARRFLREDFAAIDGKLPEWLAVLRSAGASECFHKHGTFYSHLLEVYRILVLWGAPKSVARCGLFHSAYSNSYVNLAIFKPGVDRSRVADLIGDAAEELVHHFCIVPRQELIHDMLLFRFTDEQLAAAAAGDREQQTPILLPEGFLTVKNIRSGEPMNLPRRLVAVFVLLTMADFADQLYNWQDKLFDNQDGSLDFHGNTFSALWPGDVKPGLWISSCSRMGLLLRGLIKEDELFPPQVLPPWLDFELKLPPVFNFCSRVLPPGDQIRSRDLYLEAVGAEVTDRGIAWIESKLKEAAELNQWVAEPHLVLAQVHCLSKSFQEAQKEAEVGLGLLLQWGTVWDKRISWEAWVAWARVLQMNASQKTWPATSWGMINLGLVKT